MSNDPIPQKPTPVKTIRVGTEMFDDVQDYIVLIRSKDKDGDEFVTRRMSSTLWAHGAMLQEIGFLRHMNTHWGCEDDEEQNDD